jgi:hypothetical protein
MNLFTTMQVGDREMDLASWGICRCNREVNNQASDSFGFDLQAQFDAPDLFPFDTKIIIRRQRQQQLTPNQTVPFPNAFVPGSGKVFFVGRRKQHIRRGTGRMENFKYKFAGVWERFLEFHEYQQPWYWLLNQGGKVTVQGTFYSTQIVLGQSGTLIIESNGVQTTQETMAEAMIDAATWTMHATTNKYGTPEFQIDTALPTSNFDGVGGWEGYFPMQAANDITTAEAIRKVLQYVPQSSAWFDCSTTSATGGPANEDAIPLPTFRVNTRNTAQSVTLPLSMGMGTKPEIERRDDLIPECINYKYRVRSNLNGVSTETMIDDIACPIGSITAASGQVPAKFQPYQIGLEGTLGTYDFTGANETIVQLNVQPIPLNNTPATLALWMEYLASSLSNSSIVGVDWARDINGNPLPPSLTYASGGAADPRYVYYLVGGPAPTGLVDPLNPNLPQGVQLKLAQAFNFTEVTTDASNNKDPVAVKTETKTVDLYCYSMPAGGYVTNYVPSELIPAGLANFVYQIETKPQYQGTWTVTEQDITDVCPMGTNLNISGGLPEWETMNAQVQQISYDLIAGTTTLTFGPAKHLGGDDFIQRIRINRGPRWLYLIGNNVSGGVNQNTAVSGPTQLKDTQSAATMNSYLWMSANPSTPIKDSGGVPIGTTIDVTVPPATPTITSPPVGGQIILNTGNVASPPATAAPALPAATVHQAGSLVLTGWNATSLKTPPVGTQCIVLTMVDLNKILALIPLSGANSLADPSIKLRALQTCEGPNTWRIFACSPLFTTPAGWTPPQ